MKLPPKVPGLPLLGNVLTFRRDPLAFLTSATRDHGDVTRVQLGPMKPYLIGDPELVGEILVGNAKLYMKDAFLRDLREVVGNGLLSSEGDFWKRQRRLAQPPFHAKRVAGYGETFVELTSAAIAGWRDGEALDVHRAMMHLTLEIVGKTLFGADVGSAAHDVGTALEAVLARYLDPLRIFFPLLDTLPTAQNARFHAGMRRLDEIVYGMIRARRAEGATTRDDLLAMLMEARDDDGSSMSDLQLRDEAMTLFLAGHETTAIAMSWTLYLLSQNPDIEKAVARAVHDNLEGRAPTASDMPKLKLVEQVVMESMRLMPPAWSLGREALVDTTLAGYDVPKGTQLWMSPWALHRDPRWFAEPLAFRPERFDGEWQKRIPKHGYLPFGGGPRICIGNAFAMLELTLMLATILQRFSLTLVPGHPIVPVPGVTLRPKYGVKMVVHTRS